MERIIEDKENLSRDVHEIKDGVQQILLSQEKGNRITKIYCFDVSLSKNRSIKC